MAGTVTEIVKEAFELQRQLEQLLVSADWPLARWGRRDDVDRVPEPRF